ncbi:hypothetical protein NLI96_g2527 [Meripilus lineatus]|uniref:Uncharacterized protein n=1 Tax=Meripilus lineatus TaxID=2056292 RepID=A0AAD5VDX6_9APHY|nr:hypothetical protein NLI96_g2527 [Physisporinus lineatus]
MTQGSYYPRAAATIEECSAGAASGDFNLRVASIFVIFVGSLGSALLPVLAKSSPWLSRITPVAVLDFAKYFGSGVIIATAFIHLLDGALKELQSPCLAPGWQQYPWALATVVISIFFIFVFELLAFRWGSARLKKLGVTHDPHGHGPPTQESHAFENTNQSIHPIEEGRSEKKDLETASVQGPEQVTHTLEVQETGNIADSALSKIVGVAILEFGVLLHSFFVGLTLAVDANFKVLFVAILFHQIFEGLGVSARLAYVGLPKKYNYFPIGFHIDIDGVLVGTAVGLGIRTTYTPGSATSSMVAGIMDAFSAGILIYTGLVELLAHEFLYNREMIEGSNGHLAYALICTMLGVAGMGLIGKWA